VVIAREPRSKLLMPPGHWRCESGVCGTWAAWRPDLLKPHVAKLVVCNPRKNALLKDGNKSDRIDAHKLAELLYLNKLSSVYHGETGVRMLREQPGAT